MNWQGRPLVSHKVVVDLIAATRTATGLEVEARLDMRRVLLERHEFHGEWNYTIRPTVTRQMTKK